MAPLAPGPSPGPGAGRSADPGSDVRLAPTSVRPDVRVVADLADRARASDGVAPLGEQTLLNLRDPAATDRAVRHWVGALPAAYAQWDPATGAAEAVVDPAGRGRGLGTALVAAVLRAAPSARFWAHGDLPAARRVARRLGLERVRELWEMDTDLAPRGLEAEEHAGAEERRKPVGSFEPVGPFEPAGSPAPGTRAFEPARDAGTWLEVNARAFASHPEQGRMTMEDLQARMAEPWFDPGDLIWSLRPDGTPSGFVWLKVTGDLGEIYALAVDPSDQGRGLGGELTRVGLERLRARGVLRAHLYVEADNAAAVRAYRRAGFAVCATDVQYALPSDGARD